MYVRVKACLIFLQILSVYFLQEVKPVYQRKTLRKTRYHPSQRQMFSQERQDDCLVGSPHLLGALTLHLHQVQKCHDES